MKCTEKVIQKYKQLIANHLALLFVILPEYINFVLFVIRRMTLPNPSSKKTCICCGSVSQFIYEAYPLDYCLDKKFGIYECENCGHGSTEGIDKDDLTLVYEEGAYDPKEKFWHKILRPAFNIFEIAKVGYLKQSNSDGKALLEIGTGKGSFLKSALNSGYDAYGIEPSSRSYKVAKQKLGDRVIHCALENMHEQTLLQRKFDFIMLWHVLEHLPEPENAIRLLKPYLKPNGIIIVGIPNFDSYQSRIGKSNWYHLDPPRHLSHYTPYSADLLFKKTGLLVKKTIYTSFFQNFLGEIITFNNLILPHKNILLNVLRFNSFYFRRTNFLSRTLNLLSFFILTSLLFFPSLLFTHVSQILKKSGTIVVIAENTGS